MVPPNVDKWMEFELKRLNRGLVTRKKPLTKLLKEENPQCVTREEETYLFNPEVLKRIAAVLEEGEDVMLPITIHLSSELEDSCYITDEVAASILRRLENFGKAYPFRDGRMWLPNSLAYSLMLKYVTAIQGLFL